MKTLNYMISEVSTSSVTLWRILSKPGHFLHALLGTGVQPIKWNPSTGVKLKMKSVETWDFTFH